MMMRTRWGMGIAGIVAAMCAGAGCKGGGDAADVNTQTAKFAGRGSGLDGTADDPSQPVVFRIVAPADGATIEGNRVAVTFELENYTLSKGPDGTGNHVHFILDNGPYVPWYDTANPYVLEDVPEGTHVLRAFASRPWHESWKNPEAFASVTFHVIERSASPLGFDAKAPFITYSRPKGTYKASDASIMLDFWVSNCTIEPGGYTVRYTVDGTFTAGLTRWEPVPLVNLKPGQHSLVLELLDPDGNLCGNKWSRTERTITVE